MAKRPNNKAGMQTMQKAPSDDGTRWRVVNIETGKFVYLPPEGDVGSLKEDAQRLAHGLQQPATIVQVA